MTSTGELRHVLSLQECIRVPDGGGGRTEYWQDIANDAIVFAALAPANAGLEAESRRLSHGTEWRIILRYRDDITPQLRLCDEAYSYRILSLRDMDDRRAYLEITAAREDL